MVARLGNMELSKRFIVDYKCIECGEELELEGIFFPELTLPCDECERTTTFKATEVIQPSELGYVIRDNIV